MIKTNRMKRHSQNDLRKDAKEVWQKRLGHPSHRIVFGMMDDKNYKMNDDMKGESHQCKTLMQAEGTKEPANEKLFGGSRDVTVHVDICGPMSYRSIGENSYFLTMKMALERYTRDKILKSKIEAIEYTLEYMAWSDRNSRINDHVRAFTWVQWTCWTYDSDVSG